MNASFRRGIRMVKRVWDKVYVHMLSQPLYLTVLLSLFIRVLTYLAIVEDPMRGTDLPYWNGAINLRVTGVFSEMSPPSVRPTAVCPPGYSLWMALWGASVKLVIIAQILASAATTGLIYKIAEKLGGPKSGFAAGLFHAMAPYSAYMASRIASETLFVFLITISLILSIEGFSRERDSLITLSMAAITLGTASLVRPIGIGLIGIWGVWVMARYRKGIAKAILLVGIACLPLVPWGIRNEVLFGDPLLGGTNADNVFAHYVAAWVLSRAEGISAEAARQAIGPIDPFNANAQQLHKLRLESWRVLRRYPLEWMRGYIQGIPILLFGLEPYGPDLFPRPQETLTRGIRDFLFQGKIAHAFRAFIEQRLSKFDKKSVTFYLYSIFYNFITLILSFYGIRYLFRKSKGLCSLLVIFVLWLILAPCPQTSARFRMPIEPLLAILSSGFILARRSRLHQCSR